MPVKSLGTVLVKRLRTENLSQKYVEFSVDGRTIRYAIPNRLSEDRARTLFTKEPTTLVWLETFQKDEVFLDIGANVGMYSVYAGAYTGCRVIAFEPEAQNFAQLNQNIILNGLKNARAFCVAVSDRSEFNDLYVDAVGPAGSHNMFGSPEDKRSRQSFVQGCFSESVDQLVARGAIPVPNHIKIDVDGLERKIFEGMSETLKNPALKSVLFEIDNKLPDSLRIFEDMKSLGWKYSEDQIRLNRHAIVPAEKVYQWMKIGKGGQNVIFFRDENHYAPIFTKFLQTFIPPDPPVQKSSSFVKKRVKSYMDRAAHRVDRIRGELLGRRYW